MTKEQRQARRERRTRYAETQRERQAEFEAMAAAQTMEELAAACEQALSR